MEIRCGKCNKLFRVADEKIKGSGIKFSCTKCGETVKITKEDFSNYTLSKATVSALDLFEPKPKAGPAPMSEQVRGDNAAAHVPLSPPKDAEQPSSAPPDILREEEESIFSEPNPFEESPLSQTTQPEQEPPFESEPAFAIPMQPEMGPDALIEQGKKTEHNPEPSGEPAVESTREPSTELAVEPAREQAAEPAVESAMTKPGLEPAPQQAAPVEPEQKQEQHQAMTVPVAVPLPQTEPKPQPKPEESAIRSQAPETQPAAPHEPSQTQPKTSHPVPEKEPLEQVPGEAPQEEHTRTGRMVLILLSALILLAAAGYGTYRFILPSLQHEEQPAVVMTSIQGLRVVNPSGSVEQNGDLLIAGSVENLTDKERTGWYVVVDVYDANGKVLNKLRLLNGKQIYTRTDYEILSKRGVNVDELKTKTLQSQGVVIPAKGSVPFELHYFDPPVGIASFNAMLEPFDPIRLFKEIQKETK
jgi:phage FluMu protein Com